MPKREAAVITSVRSAFSMVHNLTHSIFSDQLQLTVKSIRSHVPGPGSASEKERDVWRSALRKVQQWLYSWMKPGYVEDDDELKISKFLLLQFICSAAFLRAASGQVDLVTGTLRFLQRNVFVHESLYLHYLRRMIRHFDQSHSSPHEGTNFGLKNNAVPMRPNMGLDISASTLNLQSDLKTAKLDAFLHGEFSNTDKRWSDLLTSPYLVSFGEALMMSEDIRSENKTAHRTGPSRFQVHYTPKTSTPNVGDELELPQDREKTTGKKKGKKKKARVNYFAHVPLPLFSRV